MGDLTDQLCKAAGEGDIARLETLCLSQDGAAAAMNAVSMGAYGCTPLAFAALLGQLSAGTFMEVLKSTPGAALQSESL